MFAVKCVTLISFLFGLVASQNVSVEEYEELHNCKCVVYYLCTNDNYVITDGKGIIDMRAGDDVERLFCPDGGNADGMPQFCCKLKNQVIEDLTTTTPKPVKRPPRKPEVVTLTRNITCGVQRPTINIRFQNTDISSTLNGEFPWAAAIYRKNTFRCTGSLIHPKVVLTVAHYVTSSQKSDYKVVVNGLTELGTEKPDDERSVVEVIRHPDFYSGGLHNDIALLILNESYVFSQFGTPINEICLPPDDSDFNEAICIAAGWNNKNSSIPLKKVVLPVVPREKCESNLKSYTTLGSNFKLHSSFICAGGVEGQDACLGDGGSPLMCAIDGVHYLAGLVSWGKGCAKGNVPGVYTDVSQFREWIRDELAKQDIDIVF